jgi:hypothetical protein
MKLESPLAKLFAPPEIVALSPLDVFPFPKVVEKLPLATFVAQILFVDVVPVPH